MLIIIIKRYCFNNDVVVDFILVSTVEYCSCSAHIYSAEPVARTNPHDYAQLLSRAYLLLPLRHRIVALVSDNQFPSLGH